MNIAAREPIVVRELRQAARQRRVPLLVGMLPLGLLLIAMLLAVSLGEYSDPTRLGTSVFEAFFALATCVVVLVGATVAASGISSEREGHTWEALLLSGLSPVAIARGKFLSAFAQAALGLLVLTPGAGLAFLFGGVPIRELLVAFGLLLAVAALAVTFGLAVSSYARSARGALAGALLSTIIVGPAMYGLFSTAGMVVGEELHDESLRGATWLAHAIATAPLSLRSLLFFVVDPLLLLVLPGTFLLAVTRANLSDASADRSTGIRRWYLVATALLVVGAIASNAAIDTRSTFTTLTLLLVLATHLGFATLVFGAEPLGPSRRVEAGWARTGGATLARRFLGPGIAGATVLHATFGSAALLAVYLAGHALADEHLVALELAAGYVIGFHLFLAGGSGLLAARLERPAVARAAVVVGGLFLAVAPLLAGSVLRLVSLNPDEWKLLGSLSPLFLLTGSSNPDPATVHAARFGSGAYCLAGAVLVALTVLVARRRLNR